MGSRIPEGQEYIYLRGRGKTCRCCHGTSNHNKEVDNPPDEEGRYSITRECECCYYGVVYVPYQTEEEENARADNIKCRWS